MDTLPVRLNIAIVSSDLISSGVLKGLIETNGKDVISVKVFQTTREAQAAFKDGRLNSMFIDLFSVGVNEGVILIEHIRNNFPSVSICLFSTQSNLTLMPGIEEHWRSRFGHYYKIIQDQNLQSLAIDVQKMLWKLSTWIQRYLARVELDKLSKQMASSNETHKLSNEHREQIEKATSAARIALETKEEDFSLPIIVPGMATGQIGQLVETTLAQATKSIQTTSKANISILIFGAALVTASFAVAITTHLWEAMAFGGFGLVGVVASLITNPLKSIAVSARRLVQVQIAYFSFLNQLTILNVQSENTNILERSQRLGEETSRALQSFEKYFGD